MRKELRKRRGKVGQEGGEGRRKKKSRREEINAYSYLLLFYFLFPTKEI